MILVKSLEHGSCKDLGVIYVLGITYKATPVQQYK